MKPKIGDSEQSTSEKRSITKLSLIKKTGIIVLIFFIGIPSLISIFALVVIEGTNLLSWIPYKAVCIKIHESLTLNEYITLVFLAASIGISAYLSYRLYQQGEKSLQLSNQLNQQGEKTLELSKQLIEVDRARDERSIEQSATRLYLEIEQYAEQACQLYVRKKRKQSTSGVFINADKSWRDNFNRISHLLRLEEAALLYGFFSDYETLSQVNDDTALFEFGKKYFNISFLDYIKNFTAQPPAGYAVLIPSMTMQLIYLWDASKRRTTEEYSKDGFNQTYKADNIGLVLKSDHTKAGNEPEVKISYRNMKLYCEGVLNVDGLKKIEYVEEQGCQFEINYNADGTSHCIYQASQKTSEQYLSAWTNQMKKIVSSEKKKVIDADYGGSGFVEGYTDGIVGENHFVGTVRRENDRWIKIKGIDYGVTVKDPARQYDYDEQMAAEQAEEERCEDEQYQQCQQQEYELYQEELEHSGRYIAKEDFVYEGGVVTERKNRRLE